jgi:uncharacterized protein YbjQ (UPF0145 family)
MAEILISTTDTIPGKTITKNLGIVRGNTIRARHIGRDVMAGFKNIVGGEIKSYTELMTVARDEALNRMINEAIDLKADAIVGVRFMTAQVMQGAAEILAYGTAVKLK